MARHGALEATLNGTALTGDCSQNEIAGVDITSNHTQFRSFTMGVRSGAQTMSARAQQARVHDEITWIQVMDQTTPLYWDGLVRNQNFAAKFKFFDNQIDAGGQTGELRHRFTVEVVDGRVTGVRIVHPDAEGPQTSTEPIYVEVKAIAAKVILEDVINGATIEDDWRLQVA